MGVPPILYFKNAGCPVPNAQCSENGRKARIMVCSVGKKSMDKLRDWFHFSSFSFLSRLHRDWLVFTQRLCRTGDQRVFVKASVVSSWKQLVLHYVLSWADQEGQCAPHHNCSHFANAELASQGFKLSCDVGWFVCLFGCLLAPSLTTKLISKALSLDFLCSLKLTCTCHYLTCV